MIDVTLTQLEYMIAVDTHRHFVSAAEACFVTQPTLSMQIKKLEDSLGEIVFDRSRQPIVPTDVGKKIIAQARIIISESKKLKDLILENAQEISGELSIGIIPSLAPYLLPLFMGKFSKTYPLLKIHIIEMMSEEIMEQLKKDVLDVGILVTPLNESGIIEQPLFYEKMLLYIHKEHNLAKKKGIKSVDIISPDLWLLTKGHCFRTQVLNLCSYQQSHKSDLPFTYESGSLETLKKFVEKEGGFTLLPEMATYDIAKGGMGVLKQFEEKPVREVSLVYTRNYSKRKVLKILEEEIKKAVPKTLLSRELDNIVAWR